ncbi:ATP-dependent (S)-NAD(P)H-hydrate dehydratase isoform X1 [Nasonia vitripennis]|uniref:ATP-dependent (S)-NAD(P)H-hydrate dehydratase n=2 Tax=Nasonia vitripennis TaxID=7425 RepID=A0A7M7PZB0_NASVI|nr:ATP-dependent (S)-NAD(P)H-hydrate dehydratase isoform X1 [Nasonia vitripennis]
MILCKKFVCRSKTFFCSIASKMSTNAEDQFFQAAKQLVPVLSNAKHKGQAGRIGIVGGSLEYSGAPFFAGMSALRTGADLVHIFCCKEASIPIKSFSPELIVHPVLDDNNALSQIEPWLERLHVILIGPGLGRDQKVLNTVGKLIEVCRGVSKPLVIDADGLFLVGQNTQLIKNYPSVVLTPNSMEFTRLVKAFLNKTVEPEKVVDGKLLKELAQTIGEKVVILHKGSTDVIGDGRAVSTNISCSEAGSFRRCGGQGDLLSGALSTFTCWSQGHEPSEPTPQMLACYAASRLVRECNSAAFKIGGRGMLASDMLHQVAPTFAKLYET